jgi:predicted ATP-grasp superfamily ATP-dependent carboligase
LNTKSSLTNPKTLLLTGARSFAALDLARTFSSAGARVICADSFNKSICRYSRSVSCFYEIAPPSTKFESFVADLQKIINKEHVDMLIPTCEEILYVGKAKDQLETSVFAESFERLEELHNKWKFYQLLSLHGFVTPETYLWKEGETPPGKWIIKPMFSRFAASIHVVEHSWPQLTAPPSNPFICQRYIEGEKLCSYSICHRGKITAHGVYTVLHSMGIGSAICFKSVKNQDVDDFIQKFVATIGFTGQIAFDFIQADRLYCIECNPRATSGVHLFERSKDLARSFFNNDTLILPKEGKTFHEHLFMLWYGIKQKEIFSRLFWSHFFSGKNPLWMKSDNRVLAAMPIILIDIAMRTLFRKQGLHQAMTQDIEYNGEFL